MDAQDKQDTSNLRNPYPYPNQPTPITPNATFLPPQHPLYPVHPCKPNRAPQPWPQSFSSTFQPITVDISYQSTHMDAQDAQDTSNL